MTYKLSKNLAQFDAKNQENRISKRLSMLGSNGQKHHNK